jgi:hypothetical protein
MDEPVRQLLQRIRSSTGGADAGLAASAQESRSKSMSVIREGGGFSLEKKKPAPVSRSQSLPAAVSLGLRRTATEAAKKRLTLTTKGVKRSRTKR